MVNIWWFVNDGKQSFSMSICLFVMRVSHFSNLVLIRGNYGHDWLVYKTCSHHIHVFFKEFDHFFQ